MPIETCLVKSNDKIEKETKGEKSAMKKKVAMLGVTSLQELACSPDQSAPGHKAFRRRTTWCRFSRHHAGAAFPDSAVQAVQAF